MGFISAGPARLYFEEAGRGRLALFVHGGGLDHSMWRHQLAALGGRRRCVAIDLPGHGRSQAGRLDLFAVIRALDHRRADLVGHSFGGHEVLRAWWRSPQAVRSIALIGVMFSADAPQRVAPPGATSFERPVPVEAQAEVVRSITVPFMVATGVDDTNTPAPLCRKLAAANPQARWVEIPGAGHMSPLEQPAAVTAALKRLW